MRLRRLSLGACAAGVVAATLSPISVAAQPPVEHTRVAPGRRAERVLDAARLAACGRIPGGCTGDGPRVVHAALPVPVQAQPLDDGTLVGRQRLSERGGVALDLIAYTSGPLVVGGLLCYPDDGARHSAVIHVHGGIEGVFDHASGNLVQTCIDWAGLHGRTAFAPSLRGQDAGEGTAELCLGEADDVVAAAKMLRSLEVTDPARVALVGGSIGGCVVLKAAPRIPDLKAVVALVPPTSWRDLVVYHRTAWAPQVETLCDGATQPWNFGGPALADAFDSLICGHADCPLEAYNIRSPLPGLLVQSAPTLIVSAESDNIVPVEQQLLWSLLRQATGHPVTVVPIGKCDAPALPPAAVDENIFVRDAFHLLSSGSISSGMLFLMAALDGRLPQ